MSSTGPPHGDSSAARRVTDAAVAAIKALRFTLCLCGAWGLCRTWGLCRAWGLRRAWGFAELSDDLSNRSVAFFNQMESAAIVLEVHFLVIETHLVRDGRVNVAAVMPVLHCLIANLIGRAVHRPALDAAAREP